MFKQKEGTVPPVLLVIGAHREELAFGEQLVSGLDEKRFSLLRIPRGISGERPCENEREKFADLHRQLYQQILDYVQPGQLYPPRCE